MKKRLRKTGEIVDVISCNKYSGSERNLDLDWVSYIDSKGCEHEHEKGLNIYWDFEDVYEELTKQIDWEQVRIDAAIASLNGFSANSHEAIVGATIQKIAELSVKSADALIAELKKGVGK